MWAKMNAPSPEELAEMQRVQDSIEQVEKLNADTPSITTATTAELVEPDSISLDRDSLMDKELAKEFGVFYPATRGEEEIVTLENDVLTIDISSKGGKISGAKLKDFKKLLEDEEHNEVYLDLLLLEDKKNKFEYLIPVANAPGGYINSSDLFFAVASKSDQRVELKAELSGGKSISQIYTLKGDDGYGLDYDLVFEGLDRVINPSDRKIKLHWISYLDKIEKSTQYERIYSTAYFKEVGQDPSYCSMSRSVQEVLDEHPIKWISHSNQFFNSTLLAKEEFGSAVVESEMLEDPNEDMKKLTSIIDIPLTGSSQEQIGMEWYIGPNEFDRLQEYGYDMEDIVPFGWSIFGSINRWIIRPIFSFLSQFFGSKGLVILLLTLIVKSLVYPLTYKMLYSQSKMSVLKPEMEKLRNKHKDDQQKAQMETMKIYREYGVNPAGGCFPMILQMPIWFALYRFFPASIEFRQASFLWANDLSSYDVFLRLPFNIPMMGSHLSLFTLLWAISMLIYTYYNSKMMDMSSMNAMPAMKWMQYLMPVGFIVFFNSYASGLTCYLLFSNLFNIAQTLITKNYIIDKEKIKRELDANKKKPKKKGGFQQRLQKALEEQQRQAAQRNKKK